MFEKAYGREFSAIGIQRARRSSFAATAGATCGRAHDRRDDRGAAFQARAKSTAHCVKPINLGTNHLTTAHGSDPAFFGQLMNAEIHRRSSAGFKGSVAARSSMSRGVGRRGLAGVDRRWPIASGVLDFARRLNAGGAGSMALHDRNRVDIDQVRESVNLISAFSTVGPELEDYVSEG